MSPSRCPGTDCRKRTRILGCWAVRLFGILFFDEVKAILKDDVFLNRRRRRLRRSEGMPLARSRTLLRVADEEVMAALWTLGLATCQMIGSIELAPTGRTGRHDGHGFRPRMSLVAMS